MALKSKVLLGISFGLNAALMAGFLINRSSTQPTIASGSAENEVTAAQNPKTKRLERAAQNVIVKRAKDLNWGSVESQDYREYIQNLRAIGCPEETIRDIIIADINKLYASKIAALYPSAKEFKFWRVEDRVARKEEKDRDHSRHELEQEKRELIHQLLGVDYDAELARASGKPDNEDARYGFLSPEKQEQAKTLREKYRQMERELFKDGGGWTPENRAKFSAMRAEGEAEMAKLLGPADFEQYQFRNSYTARSMRESLTGFQPNEDEFRDIYAIRKAYDDQYGFAQKRGGNEAVSEEQKGAQQKLDEQLKATLGADRFREYQLSQDERYRSVYDFTQKYDLPRQTADALYAVRIAAEVERQRIRSDATLTADARNAALNSLANDTRQALIPTLGQDTWAKYEAKDGAWVNGLSQARDQSGNRVGRNRPRRN